MKRSDRRRNTGRRRNNRSRKGRFESLEQRRLLAVVAGTDIFVGGAEEFVVRRDEAEPVELYVNKPRAGGDIAEPFDVVESGVGTITFGEDNQILYQPQSGFIGVDVFTIAFQHEVSTTDAAEPTNVRVAVNVVEPLLAVDDWYQVPADSSAAVNLDVLQNDSFNARYQGIKIDRDLAIQSVTSDGEGTVSISDDQQLVYQPPTDFAGVETLTYTMVDQDGYTAVGTAQVRVTESEIETLWPEQLQQELVELAVDRYQYSFGAGASTYDYFYEVDPRLDVGVPTGTGVPTEAGGDTSGTNNQIADVDESDRIKTDGDYLYVLSAPDQNEWNGWDIFPLIGLPFIDFGRPARSGLAEGESAGQFVGENLLTIVDIQTPDTPMIVSRQILSDDVLSLDLHGDRLTVISQRDAQTVLTTLDVSDAVDPKTVSTTLVDGTFHQARRVGDSLFIFTQDRGVESPQLDRISVNDGEFSFYETGEQYLDRVRDSLTEHAFASQQVFDADGDPVDVQTYFVDPLEIGVSQGQRLNIITFDTSRDVGGAIDWDIKSDLGYSDPTILVTTDSIYVTHTNHASNWFFDDTIDVFDDIPAEPTITTEIDRYEITDDGTVSQSATGVVPGTLKNSFSLDEHNGLLRIATENSWFSPNQETLGSHVYVLQQTDSELETIGGVTGLAPGESIYAVRFAGDRGYVVTFRRVDPLFVIDLSQPTAPEVLGELKVPGYSQYLHVISEDHVLGVGRDADPETGLYEGLTVSLFNVSDPTTPTLQDRYLFEGGRSTFSPFAEDDPWDVQDHHAISYFAEQGVLALPYYSRDHFRGEEGDVNKPVFETSEQSAVRTFNVDVENGISVLDTIQFDSRADRTMRVGEYLYSLSSEELKVTNLLQPDGVIAELDFERDGADDFVDTMVGEEVTLDVTENDGAELESVIEVLAASLVDGAGEVSVVDNHIQFKPTTNRLTPQRIRYTARNAAGTLIEAFATVDQDMQWHNEVNRYDVNGDGRVSPRDALNSLNIINRYGVNETEVIEAAIGDSTGVVNYHADTNGDESITSLDPLEIINQLGREPAAFELGQQFSLTLDDVAALASDTLQIQPTELLEDSRCPIDVQCITEGQVRLQILVSDDDAPTSVEITYKPSESKPIQVAGYSIELVAVKPALKAGQVVELADYEFTFIATEL